MPELPEVEVILKQLQSRIQNCTIQTFLIKRTDIVRIGLSSHRWYIGSRISGLIRQGKSIILICEKDHTTRYLLAELGMTGLFLFESSSRGYEKHIHITFRLKGAEEPTLHYWNPRRFGRVYLLDEEQLQQFIKRRFGPDPRSLGQHDFHLLIRQNRGRVKALLLNQQRLAGIGNIYANEILFDARIHPHAQRKRLSIAAITRLFCSTQSILEKAIEYGGSSIRDFRAPDGSRGHFQNHHTIYQKTGSPCPRGCSTTIKRLMTERSSFYCSICQKRS